MQCEICGEEYPSEYYFETESVCKECYKLKDTEEFKKNMIK